MKFYKLFLVFIIFLPACIFSQETITGIHFNAAIKNYYKQHPQSMLKHKKALSDTISIPFFDDFAKPAIFPDAALWADSNAFVNTGFNAYLGNELTDVNKSHHPPSIGVVTLDALDQFGDIYSSLQPAIAGSADTLTSRAIDLNFLPSDSVFLSFEYQPTGVGNAPETDDSLVLEFYAPGDTVMPWRHIWSVAGSTDKTFRKVLISVNDSIFLQKGFRFRFRNYVSLGSNYEPSWLSNCDQWNLDFIYLDTSRSRNEPVIEEVAMLYPLKSILNDTLETMPWRHFQSVRNSILTSYFSMIYRKTGTTVNWNVNHLCSITAVLGNTPVYHSTSDFENALGDAIIFRGRTFDYLFNSTATDSASFLIKSYIDLGVQAAIPRYKANDTAYYHQNFYNYYAYDDGTAENGYGLSGEGTQNARMVLKYKCYKRDTLRGAQIFFNNTLDNYTGDKYFYLKAWREAGGVPGIEVANQMGEHPYFDGINEFHFHAFDSPVVIDSGATFYIGVQQTTTDMLNIGLDKNRDAHTKCYYNISGTWVQSTYPGALMIRPVFGKHFTVLSAENQTENQIIRIYPNPASDNINIQIPTDFAIGNADVIITDICGKKVNSKQFTKIVDVSTLPPGMYFISVSDYNKYTFTQKIIVTH